MSKFITSLGGMHLLLMSGCATYVSPASRFLPAEESQIYYVSDQAYARQSKGTSRIAISMERDPSSWGKIILLIAVRNIGKEVLTIYPEKIRATYTTPQNPVPTNVAIQSARESIAKLYTQANEQVLAAAVIGAVSAAGESSAVARQMVLNRTSQVTSNITQAYERTIRRSNFLGRESLEPDETVIGSVVVDYLYADFTAFHIRWIVGGEEYLLTFRPERESEGAR